MTTQVRWPHQVYGVEEVIKLINAGEKRIALTSPTGGGKGQIIMDLCQYAEEMYWPAVLYHNRVMLTEQMFDRLDQGGFEYGIQASGYEQGSWQNTQVASIQSVHRWWKTERSDLPVAKMVIVDEIHTEKGARMQEVLDEHEKRGAVIIVITATPIEIGHLANKLVVAGNNSSLRACGALVPAYTFAPDEPSENAFKSETEGVLQLKDEYREKMIATITGRVIDHYHIINIRRSPSILFAPDVASSLWFAHQFADAGISAAHIDSNRIWLNGETLSANRENRKKLLAASRSKEVEIVCNRFVMREGIDMPWLGHGILACTFGSLGSFLQATGRILRNYPGLGFVTLADHGGNFWRYGSVNEDRIWTLGCTERELYLKHTEPYRSGGKPEPTPCPQCKKLREGPGKCSHCGYIFQGKQRIVIQTNGKLRVVKGDIYRKRRYSDRPELVKNWVRCVMRCRRSNRTMAQARGLFMYENRGYSPAPNYPYMPSSEAQWCLKVSDVFPEKLRFPD